jgi:hypothetical protein
MFRPCSARFGHVPAPFGHVWPDSAIKRAQTRQFGLILACWKRLYKQLGVAIGGKQKEKRYLRGATVVLNVGCCKDWKRSSQLS